MIRLLFALVLVAPPGDARFVRLERGVPSDVSAPARKSGSR